MLNDIFTGNLLIGLREGLEAALVVSILVAFVKKTGHSGKLAGLWVGVGAALALTVGAIVLVLSLDQLDIPFRTQETIGGGLSVVAVGFVTSMVFWMKRNSRTLSTDLRDRAEAALSGGALALAGTGFLATGREGLETALFLSSSLQASGPSAAVGAFVGIAIAVVLAYGLYRRSIALNLATFFRWTGAGLVVVAAGVLAYGIHDLQEAGVLPGVAAHAFDISSTINPGSWYGTLLKGVFNFQPDPTWLQVVAYLGYLGPVLFLFLRTAPLRRSASAAAPAGASSSSASSTHLTAG